MKVVLTASNMVTPYGLGTGTCWDGLLSGKTALQPLERIDTSAFNSQVGGTVDGLEATASDSLVFQLLERLFADGILIPEGAPLLLASTTGEVDLIERAVLAGTDNYLDGALEQLLSKVAKRLDARSGATLISSACISSTAALAQGASMIRAGEVDAVFVAACDALSEFVFSGFSSLMALDADRAHPFDAHRKGLCVGEAAAYAVLMSEERALREGQPILGEICGWGLGNDANHMTGPSRDGSGLARAIHVALNLAGLNEAVVASVCAHGTGTSYNDNMEMLAFRQVFSAPRPTWSVKGGMGHTMGAAGLVETLLAFQSLEQNLVPPTVGLREPDEVAKGWVSNEAVAVQGDYVLTTNSGFGGVNAALVLKRAERIL